jgi:hypothetical protein
LRLWVVIPAGTGFYNRKNGRGEFIRFGKTKKIDTTVYRIALDERCSGPARIWVDAWVPEHHRGGFIPGDLAWIEEGVCRAYAYVDDNQNTLAPFLASGDLEWDVRETA